MILFSRTRANNRFIFLQQTTEGEIQIQSHVVVPPPDTGSLCVTEHPDLSSNITLSQDTGKFVFNLVYRRIISQMIIFGLFHKKACLMGLPPGL